MKTEKELTNFIEKNLSEEEVDLLSQDDIETLSQEILNKFMDLVWINLGKEEATEKELAVSVNEVHTLIILIFLKRNGLIYSRGGFWDRTEFGEQVKKELVREKK